MLTFCSSRNLIIFRTVFITLWALGGIRAALIRTPLPGHPAAYAQVVFMRAWTYYIYYNSLKYLRCKYTTVYYYNFWLLFYYLLYYAFTALPAVTMPINGSNPMWWKVKYDNCCRTLPLRYSVGHPNKIKSPKKILWEIVYLIFKTYI